MACMGFDMERESKVLECATKAILEGCSRGLSVFHMIRSSVPGVLSGYSSQNGPRPNCCAVVNEIAVGDVWAC